MEFKTFHHLALPYLLVSLVLPATTALATFSSSLPLPRLSSHLGDSTNIDPPSSSLQGDSQESQG